MELGKEALAGPPDANRNAIRRYTSLLDGVCSSIGCPGKAKPGAALAVERKLAPILAPGIAGYSRLMGADEAASTNERRCRGGFIEEQALLPRRH